MKRINIILAALALLSLVSCSRKVEFPHETFVTFDDVTFSVNEQVGTVSIPVSVYNPNGGEVQVIVTGIDGDGEKGAVNGKDYEIVSPALGVLTFAGGESTLNVEVDLMHDSKLTGTKNFNLEIKSVTDGINVGGFNVATVKILDAEHPLAPMIGEWTGTLMGLTGTDYETTINIEAVDDDDTFTKLTLDSGVDPAYGGPDVAYNATADIKTGAIVLPSEQLNGYENFYLQGVALDATGAITSLTDSFGFVLQGGKLYLAAPYVVVAPGLAQGGGDALAEGYYYCELTKK